MRRPLMWFAAHKSLRQSMDRYTMGNIELSDDEWAKLRQYTATADEIAKTPTTFDERNVPGCGYTTWICLCHRQFL